MDKPELIIIDKELTTIAEQLYSMPEEKPYRQMFIKRGYADCGGRFPDGENGPYVPFIVPEGLKAEIIETTFDNPPRTSYFVWHPGKAEVLKLQPTESHERQEELVRTGYQWIDNNEEWVLWARTKKRL